jgi:hypothetical protein
MNQNHPEKRGYVLIRGGTNKSLARLGRKQATATKLRIYSTYSPRSLINFLACYSNFCPRQQWPPRRTKNGDLSIVFSVQGTGGSPTGPDSENRAGDQDTGSPGRPVSSGLQVQFYFRYFYKPSCVVLQRGHLNAYTNTPCASLLHISPHETFKKHAQDALHL